MQPQITVDSLVEAALQPDRLTLDLTAIYTIEKAGVFRLELDVPAGFDVKKVHGVDVGVAPVQVDTHYLEGDKKTRLVVNLSRKAIGRVALGVQLQKDLRLPELLTPMSKPAQIPLPLPLVAPRTAERATGRLVILAPETCDHRTREGRRPAKHIVREAYEGIRAPALVACHGRPVLTYAFNSEEPVDLTLAAERRKPQVTARQLMEVRVEEGVVKYDFTFFYDILYSGVKSLRIDVPVEVAEGLRVVTPGFHEKTIDPPPADVAKGDVAWSLSGESELLGTTSVKLHWEKPIGNLEIGKHVNLSSPI